LEIRYLEVLLYKHFKERKMSAAATAIQKQDAGSNASASDGVATELIDCNYGEGDTKVQIQVPKWVLCQFRVFRDINEDCPSDDGSFYASIPTLKDAKGVSITFDKAELELFFELAAMNPLNTQDLEAKEITNDMLKRYLILTNFLDYELLLNTLCCYTAFLIKEGKFALN